MKNLGNDMEAKAKKMFESVGKLISYQSPAQQHTFDCFRIKSIEKGIVKTVCENEDFLEMNVPESERLFNFTTEEFLKGKWAIIQEDDSNEESAGHLTFIGDFEYFKRNEHIIRAPRSNPIFPDGQRCGRWYTKASRWDESLAYLKEQDEKDFEQFRKDEIKRMEAKRV